MSVRRHPSSSEDALIVLDYGADFDRVATVTGQRTHRVVPPGHIE